MKDKRMSDGAMITWILLPFVTMLVSAIVFGFMVIERFDSMLVLVNGLW